MVLNKLLFWLSGYLPCKIINGENGQPYLERYMIARWGKDGEHTIFLHRFLDSDPDKGIHDHPWDSKSFILAGGYNEKRLVKEGALEKVILRNIRPLTFNKIGKGDFHQIIMKKNTPAWTLFYHGPRVKHWGFQYYDVLPNGTMKRSEFVPFNDTTKIDEKWELTAKKGKDTQRTYPNYILDKH